MTNTPESGKPANSLTDGLSHHLERLPAGWRAAFSDAPVQDTLQHLNTFLNQRLAEGAVIYPRYPFRALDSIQPHDVKVVILGQDPYHGPDQAQGLAFSVPDHCPRPPSLRNILTELARDYPEQLLSGNHDLTPWTQQGVLLFNAVLTVEGEKPASHARLGWETISDAILQHVAQTPSPKVFMLWGAYAQRKRELLESNATGPIQILTANHPSPLSARRPPKPFLGCGHFSAANTWLKDQGVDPVNWFSL